MTVRPALAWPHLLLAMAVVAVWGTNFPIIRIGLDHLPPLTFAALRFTFVLIPAAFFIKRPAVSWRNLAAYGALMGVGQFGVLYIAMRGQISPGLASLVLQIQVFFTIGLAMALRGEKVRPYQMAALCLAAAGLGWLMIHTNAEVTPLGLAMTLFAALSWAGCNTVARAAGSVNMLAYVVWASLFSAPPLYILALVVEGWPAIAHGLAHADAATWAVVVWQSLGNSIFGFGAWAWLLARYPAATISPLALLVPVFGMGTSALVLGESLASWKITAAVLLLSGLALNVLWPLVERRRLAA
jgi:O-acetylserine/cysteine efflux transporter